MMALPPLLSVPEIQNRLQIIFPEGTANRNFVIREMAAKTVFTMLYTGAIEGNDQWVRPDQVTRMTDAQALIIGEQESAGSGGSDQLSLAEAADSKGKLSK